MTAKKKWTQRSQRTQRTPAAAKFAGKGRLNASATVLTVTPVKKDVWRVATEKKVATLATRNSSTRAMDEATVIYARALKSLANR